MRDVNYSLKIQWTCQKCGTRNEYSVNRTDVDVLADPGKHRQACYGCEKNKEAELTACLRIY